MQLGISKEFRKVKKESALIMRKQTKIAAVVSAAALLALGASITSFAASRGTWAMTDGEWYCYDKNGDPYTDTFCVSNGKDYYVGEDGALVRSSWVDYAEGIYFVNSSGAKITSDWRLATPYEDDSADEEWYYFKSSGKRAENTKVVYKGHTYYFDQDGKMLTGWVTYESGNSNQSVDESNGFEENNTYYCDETGARVESDWVYTTAPGVTDDDADADEYWYYLKSNGKAATGKQNNVKGQTYFFDDEGVMLDGWVAKVSSGSDSEYMEIDDEDDDWHISNPDFEAVYYCGGSSDGHMKKNKWIHQLAPWDDGGEDEDKNWYWIKKNGEVFRATAAASSSNAYTGTKYDFEEGKLTLADDEDQFKDKLVEKLNINGKYYYFDKDGAMINGFAMLEGYMYYFGGDNDGAMKTGSQNVRDDTDETYKFYFGTKTSNKGQGVSKKQGGKLYYYGMLIEADDYKYEVVFVPEAGDLPDRYYIVNQNGSIQHSAKEYKEDDVIVIDASDVTFDKNGDYFTEFSKVDIQQGSLIYADEYVFGR